MLAEKQLKLVLIGNPEKKKKFLDDIYIDNFGYFKPEPDYAPFAGFTVWHLLGKEQLIFMEEDSQLDRLLGNADAFIYIDAKPQEIELFERKRDCDNCIAIDFEALNLSPVDCPAKIENLIQLAKASKEEPSEKPLLVLSAHIQNDPNCPWASRHLPRDLSLHIASILYQLTNKKGFFSSPQDLIDSELRCTKLGDSLTL